MSAAAISSSKARLASYSPLLQEPSEYARRGGRTFIYMAKEGLYFTAETLPCHFALIMRKVTECIGPSLAYLADCSATWNHAAKHFVGLVEACDLLEIVGDAHYFLNGDFLKERAKKQWYSVAGHIALVPANIITVALYSKDVFKVSFQACEKCAAAIGNLRLFSFVPRMAQAIEGWPLFRSIPNLAGKAAWLGEARPLGFVAKISLSTTGLVLVAAAYIYFAADAWGRKAKYHDKAEKYAKALNEKAEKYAKPLGERKITVKPSETSLKEQLDKLGIDNLEQRKAIGIDFVKYKNNIIKKDQAKLDLYTACSELAIKVVVLGGVTAGAGTAGSVTMVALGALALVCVGRGAYHKMKTAKPELASVI